MQYHDALAILGVANAHPGGTAVTKLWLGQGLFRDGDTVLDVGCGNGSTACEIARDGKLSVTALDVRSKMIANTLRRAKRENVNVHAVVGSAERLPMADNTFDWIVCESVLVFVNAERALREFSRVLKPGGHVLNVEMQKLAPVPKEWDQEVKEIYGAISVPDFSGWKRRYRAAGFSCTAIQSAPIRQMPIEHSQTSEPTSEAVWNDPEVIRILDANGRWLEHNHHTLGYGIFLLTNEKSHS